MSRYLTINERSPYPVKRIVRGKQNDGERHESAITLLPPDPFMYLDPPVRSPSPVVYRTLPPKNAKNKEASSFVILGEVVNTPVQSRSGSPSGRVSPFRGHGFKSPNTTRPNSRVVSPSSSPKSLASVRFNKSGKLDKPRIGRDIGLPPKSPMKSKVQAKKTPNKNVLKKSQKSREKAKKGDKKGENVSEDGDLGESTEVSLGLDSSKEDSEEEEVQDENVEIKSIGEAFTEKNKEVNKSELKDNKSKVSEGESKDNENKVNKEESKANESKVSSKEQKSNEAKEEKSNEGTEVVKLKSEGSESKGSVDAPVTSATEKRKLEKKETVGTVVEQKKEELKEEKIVENKKTNFSKFKSSLATTLYLKKGEKVTAEQIKAMSPSAKNRADSHMQNTSTTGRNSAKPPIPPKKIGVKTSSKADEAWKKAQKTTSNVRAIFVREKGKVSSGLGKEESKAPNVKEVDEIKKKNEITGVNSEDAQVKKLDPSSSKINLDDKVLEDVKKPENGKVLGESGKSEEVSSKPAVEKPEEKKPSEKLIPCFQPDKCHIAPPTMASPSPIITPTISTPSTSADLSSISMKNSQSIATAPTTVTSSSLSSVSSTVVLTGNLKRKDSINKFRLKGLGPVVEDVKIDIEKTDSNPVEVKKTNGSAVNLGPDDKTRISSQMVKAGNSIKWTNKENLSGEITSSTKVIKAEPDMEVLSPNNLRDPPPRMPPPNMAWDEEARIPNGDVPTRAEPQGKFRRFISAIWRLINFLFCCRCCRILKCCRKQNSDQNPRPSIFSRLNCCGRCRDRCFFCCGKCWDKCKCCGKCSDKFNCCSKCRDKCSCCTSCWNPFKCCQGKCCKCNKLKCCEGSKCCGKKKKPKPKTKSNKFCAKPNCSCRECCAKLKDQCLNCHEKLNNCCRSLFCLNLMCCQNLLKKCTCCHKLKCCQKNGCCSCCNPYVKRESKKLSKKGSHASTRSKERELLDVVLVEHASLMKAAIPVLPSCLAILCLILNILIPGFGTFVSGLFCLCFGKPRFSQKDSNKNRLGSFILNFIIAVAQLFTVVFCLVGWGWSVWWGVIMYKLSRKQKKLKLAEKNQKAAESRTVNQNHVDVEQG